MKTSLKFAIISISIIVATSAILSIFVFKLLDDDANSVASPKKDKMKDGVYTNPVEFTNKHYIAIVEANTTTNQFDLLKTADFVAKGTLTEVINADQELTVTDPRVFDENGKPYGGLVPITFFTVHIDKVLKGSIHDEEFRIRSIIPSKIGYEKGDSVIVMFHEGRGGYVLNGGPYGMFKLRNGLAIGHEKTLTEDALLDRLK